MNRAEQSTKSALLLNANSIKGNILFVIFTLAVASLLLAAVVTAGSHAYRPVTVSPVHGTMAVLPVLPLRNRALPKPSASCRCGLKPIEAKPTIV